MKKLLLVTVLSFLTIPAFAASSSNLSSDQVESLSTDLSVHGGSVGARPFNGGIVRPGSQRGPVYGGGYRSPSPIIVEPGREYRGGYGREFRGGGVIIEPRGFYGNWSDRRWDRSLGGYWYGQSFYAVPGLVWFTCQAVDGFGRTYPYSGNQFDARQGALNTCQSYNGYGACFVSNCWAN